MHTSLANQDPSTTINNVTNKTFSDDVRLEHLTHFSQTTVRDYKKEVLFGCELSHSAIENTTLIKWGKSFGKSMHLFDKNVSTMIVEIYFCVCLLFL